MQYRDATHVPFNRPGAPPPIGRKDKERFFRARNAETQYARQLREVAKQVGSIVRGFAPQGVIEDLPELNEALARYAELLSPWARAVGLRMLHDVSQRDLKAWIQHSKAMGIGLRKEIESAPTGLLLHNFLAEQVKLITSLPREAAQRVHKLTLEGIANGTRAGDIAAEIMASGHVTASRANTIARTEVARTASALTMVRAQHIGATHYTWQTSRDSDVRPSHKTMQGKVVAFDSPPTLDGMTGHAGMFPNCRCWIDPIIAN